MLRRSGSPARWPRSPPRPTEAPWPPTRDELAACANAEDIAHCGRLIEQEQMKRLPGLAKRAGIGSTIALFPSGTAKFSDIESLQQPTSYSLFDSIDD